MPIYEYTCQKCKAHIEIMQKVSDKPLSRHAKCGGKLEKQWSSTSFQFKGTGWYVTDYAGKKTDGKESKETKGSKTDSAPTDGASKTGATAAKSEASDKTSPDTKATSKRSKAQD